MKIAILSFSLALAISALAGQDQPASLKLPKTKSAPGAKVYIISPAHGEEVEKTFSVKFGLKGMGIAPAGIKFENTGHHHLLVDVDELPDLDKPLESTEKILHFGKGQTETTLTLEHGSHSLQLVLGDYLHIPHDKPVISKKIWITVK